MKAYSLIVFLSALIVISNSIAIHSKFGRSKRLLVKKEKLSQNQCSTESPASGCVWLFEDYVTKVEVCEDNPDLRGVEFDKRPLSIQLGEDTTVTLFSDYNYSGETRVFNTSGSYQLLDFLCQTSSVKFPSKITYTVRGYIKNALTNAVFSADDLQSVSVTFTDSNGVSYSATINTENSTYVVQLPALGTYTRNGTMTDKVPAGTSIDVTGNSDESVSKNTIFFAEVINGWRAVLSWNTVQDLDTYVYLPDKTKVWYRKKVSTDATVKLDIDDRTGTGPETTTFYLDSAQGSYKYFINSYSRLPLNTSEAKVVVYHGAYQIAELTPPTGPSKTYWYVFRIDANNGSEEYVEANSYSATIS